MKTREKLDRFPKRIHLKVISFAGLVLVAAPVLFSAATGAAQTRRPPKAQPAPQAKDSRPPAANDKVGVLVGDVKDSRTTGTFFAGMEVELKIVGDVLADAKGMRLSVEVAVDDLGRNLVGEKTESGEFKEVDSSGKTSASAKVELKNPVRQATAIRELSGSIELFTPRKDPDSTVTVNNLTRNLGVPISSPALKAAGIELVMWNKEQFEARKKAEEEKLKKEMAAKSKKEGEGQGEDLGESLASGLQKLFGGLFSSFAQMEENSLAFQITDPQSRLVGMEFEDRLGKPISNNGRMTIGGGKEKTTIYEFREKLPETARVRLLVLTPKATIKVPFKITDVPLP
ncbi:MAG TPA: hypothetical protein VFB82_01325 [Blastocatellia bacterium]|nr:hypothetical protein [Blastocatellia bacterium]